MPKTDIRVMPEPYRLFVFIKDMRRVPGFRKMRSNHDVEKVLREHRVIWPSTETSTTRSQMTVTFASRRAAEKFLRRLNEHIDKHMGESL